MELCPYYVCYIANMTIYTATYTPRTGKFKDEVTTGISMHTKKYMYLRLEESKGHHIFHCCKKKWCYFCVLQYKWA